MERTPEPWLREGFRLLREEGEDALTIERLCRNLKKTKGSFYHHFANAEAYADALLSRWEAEGTQAPIDVSRGSATPGGKAKALDEAVRGLDHGLDQAIRAWASRDPRARTALGRVDARRLAYLEELHANAGHPTPRALATLEYAALLGAQQLFPDLKSKDASEIEGTLREAMRAFVAVRARGGTS